MMQGRRGNQNDLERRLRDHYAVQRTGFSREELSPVVAAMVEADKARRTIPARPIGAVAFIASQARIVSWRVWAVQAAFLVLAVLLSLGNSDVAFTYSAVGMLSSLTVVVGASAVHASRVHHVAEVECSCRYDYASVTIARLIALGCLQALCMVVAAIALSSVRQQGFVAPYLYLCLPYFCSCAGSLWLLRRTERQAALPWCGAWALCVCGVSFLLATYAPAAYGAASLGAWALAAAAAALWLAREAHRTVADARTGAAALGAGAVLDT